MLYITEPLKVSSVQCQLPSLIDITQKSFVVSKIKLLLIDLAYNTCPPPECVHPGTSPNIK